MYVQADTNGIKATTAEKSFRLVHNGISVLSLEEQEVVLEAGGATEIFVAATKAECETEIARLGLVKPEYIK